MTVQVKFYRDSMYMQSHSQTSVKRRLHANNFARKCQGPRSVERYSDGRLQVSEPTESDKSEMATIISEKDRTPHPSTSPTHSLTHNPRSLSAHLSSF